jgi:1,4-alpha-glucan branching enzyme
MSSPLPEVSCCLVLHSHLPYVHHPEYEDFLEEDWLFEAILECYLPILRVLRDLRRDGVPVRISMSLTPPLLEMLRSKSLIEKFDRYLATRLDLLENLDERLETDLELATAAHYRRSYRDLQALWTKIDRDIPAAFGAEMEAGSVEILASAATHGFLPYLADEAAVRAQIEIGVELYRERFGRAPRGFWLPECAFVPELEAPLRAAGIDWVVVDRHGVAAARPRPASAHWRPLRHPGGLHSFGRDPDCSEQVWSSVTGYPGDPAYRELYRDLGHDADYRFIRPFLKPDGIRRDLGLKFHRVTGEVELHEKEHYDPEAAAARIADHAAHFLDQRREQGRREGAAQGGPIAIVAPYDTELFGHWWYEGPAFLDQLFRQAAARGDELGFAFRSPDDLLAAKIPAAEGMAGFSTWGRKGFGEVWLNEANQWVWPHIHEIGNRMRCWADLHVQTPFEGDQLRLLRQMGRELLLAQSSDWPFIITMETAAHYAERRVRDHVHRFLALEDALEGRPYDEEDLARVERDDAIFSKLNPRHWADPE